MKSDDVGRVPGEGGHQDPIILARLLIAAARPMQVGELCTLSRWDVDRFAAALQPLLAPLGISDAAGAVPDVSLTRTLFVGDEEILALRALIKQRSL